jgi:hypothetical protein
MNNIEDDMSAKKRGLGRGLDALLATSQAGKSSDSELPENQGSFNLLLYVKFLKINMKLLQVKDVGAQPK